MTAWKEPCRFVVTTNITSLTSFSLTTDEGTAVVGDRILLVGQTAGEENGVYIVVAVPPPPGGTFELQRAADMAISTDCVPSLEIRISEGTRYANSAWYLQTPGPIVLDTTPLNFQQVNTVYNVRQFGISPSNSATSNTDAFQALITRLTSDGGVARIFFPSGVYEFGDPTSFLDPDAAIVFPYWLTQANLVIEGEGGESSSYFATTLQYMGTAGNTFLKLNGTFGYTFANMDLQIGDAKYGIWMTPYLREAPEGTVGASTLNLRNMFIAGGQDAEGAAAFAFGPETIPWDYATQASEIYMTSVAFAGDSGNHDYQCVGIKNLTGNNAKELFLDRVNVNGYKYGLDLIKSSGNVNWSNGEATTNHHAVIRAADANVLVEGCDFEIGSKLLVGHQGSANGKITFRHCDFSGNIPGYVHLLISAVDNTTPIRVHTTDPLLAGILSAGQTVVISGTSGVANGTWTVGPVDYPAGSFTLQGSTANGTATAGTVEVTDDYMINWWGGTLEVDKCSFQNYRTLEINAASGTPVEIGTSTPHHLSVGDKVYINAVAGSGNANGFRKVKTVVDSTHFTITNLEGADVAPGGTYSGNGKITMEPKIAVSSSALGTGYAGVSLTSRGCTYIGASGDIAPLFNNVGHRTTTPGICQSAPQRTRSENDLGMSYDLFHFVELTKVEGSVPQFASLTTGMLKASSTGVITTVAEAFFNVKDPAYGAVGDDSTPNDDAINAALAAAATSGGVVFFPPGKYRITSALTVPANVSLMGCGPSASVLRIDHASANCLVYSSSTTREPQFVSALGIDAAQDCTGHLIDVDASVAGIRFDGCYLGGPNVADTCFYSGSGEGTVVFTSCVFEVGESGTHCSVASIRINVFNCRFVMPSTYYSNQCVFVGGALNMAFCNFENAAVTSGSFINVRTSSSLGCTIIGCAFPASGGATVQAITWTSGIGCWEIGNSYGSGVIVQAPSVAPGGTSTYEGTASQTRDVRRYYVQSDDASVTVNPSVYGTIEIERTTTTAQTVTVLDPPAAGLCFTLAYNNGTMSTSGTITVSGFSSALKGITTFVVGGGAISWYVFRSVESSSGRYWALMSSLTNQTP